MTLFIINLDHFVVFCASNPSATTRVATPCDGWALLEGRRLLSYTPSCHSHTIATTTCHGYYRRTRWLPSWLAEQRIMMAVVIVLVMVIEESQAAPITPAAVTASSAIYYCNGGPRLLVRCLLAYMLRRLEAWLPKKDICNDRNTCS